MLHLSYIPILVILASCSLAPEYKRPEIDTPQEWDESEQRQQKKKDIPVAEWWKSFNNEELNSLMRDALEDSNDLKASLRRIEQARASAKIAGAGLWPSLDASGNYSSARSDSGNGGDATNKYSSGLSVAYEIDLWGRNRDRAKAAESRFQASEFDHLALKLIVTSDVAKTYFEILSLRERINIAQGNLASAEEILNIIETRFNEGAVSSLEVSQQRTEVADIEASLESLELSERNAKTALAVLLGKTVQQIDVKNGNFNEAIIPEIVPKEPVTLLEQRPDIREAEAELIAANADIGVARAAFFPSLNLDLSATITANPASSAATTAVSLAESITAPIFRGGELTGEVENKKAREAELVASYHKVILTSFKEVEDALAAIKTNGKRYEILKSSADEARNAYEISRERFDAGFIDTLTLLDSQRSLLQTQDSVIQSKLAQLGVVIDLFKSTGGAWEEL